MKEALLELIEKSPNTYARYLKKSHPEIFKWVMEFPGETVAEKSYNAIREQRVLSAIICPCGREISKPFINVKKGYRTYCSGSCSSKGSIAKYGSFLTTPEGLKKRKETLIKRYGTDSMISINREKSIQTNRKRLGVDYPLQNQQIREKVKETLLAEHGVSNAFQIPSVIEKIKSTMLKNYGVTSPLKSSQIKKAMKSTMLKRYGVENAMSSPDIKLAAEKTCLERYGTSNPMSSREISKLSSRRQREESVKRGELEKRIRRFEQLYQVTPLFSEEDYLEGRDLRWRHVCGHEYSSGWQNGCLMVCPQPDCRRQSTPQRLIYEYVSSIYSGNIIVNDRSVISPYELDIYMPEARCAIEIDGIYWHQNDHEKKIDKHEECKKQNITLLTITDLSWYTNTEIWKSIIASKLGLQQKLFARRCKISQISNGDASTFLSQHHLQGPVSGSIHLGLFNSEELVAVMSFGKPRFNKHYDWELLRYASKQHLTVVGGASKLLSEFKKANDGTIITYAKKEYSQGNLYEKLGFKLLDRGSKSYFYLKEQRVISRFQAQKHKLSKLLGSVFDPSLSEKENMKNAGYLLVPDKGSMTFILN